MDLCLSILPKRSVCLIVEYEYACVCKCSYHMQQAFFAYLCLQSQHYILPLFRLSSGNSKARSTTFFCCEIETKKRTGIRTYQPKQHTNKRILMLAHIVQPKSTLQLFCLTILQLLLLSARSDFCRPFVCRWCLNGLATNVLLLLLLAVSKLRLVLNFCFVVELGFTTRDGE